MVDYSHPRNYILIGLVPLAITLIFGFTLERGYYFSVLGLTLFTAIYYWMKKDYDRSERQVLVELGLSFLGFIFLPAMFFFGQSIMPTTLDLLFFFIGYCSIMISTSLLYLLEPENPRQLWLVIGFGILVQTIIIVLVKFATAGSYLGVNL